MKDDRTKPNTAWKSSGQGGWLMVADKEGRIRHEWVEGAKSDGGWVSIDDLGFEPTKRYKLVDGHFKKVQ